MKKITICIMYLVISLASFGQQSKSAPIFKDDLLSKSKNQKTGAWILLGSGVALIITGLLVGNRKEASFVDAGAGLLIGGAGVVSTIVSISLFTKYSRNKRKAAESAVATKF